MTAPPPKRPWWKKRWRLAIAACLVLSGLYVLSAGPACYAAGRGWVRKRTVTFTYAPVFWLLVAEKRVIGRGPLDAYLRAAVDLGLADAASD